MVVILLLSITASAQKKVLMIVPDDFMWPEYSEPRKAYEAAGFLVVTAGKAKLLRPDQRNFAQYREARPINIDLTFDQVRVDNFDAVTFVGGNGAWHDFFPNQKVHDILAEAAYKRKVVGLICASTGLLGFVGNWNGQAKPIAAGKRVVGYFRVEGILRSLGRVNFIPGGVNEPGVAIDGRLVTGRNFESSTIFGSAVVKTLLAQ